MAKYEIPEDRELSLEEHLTDLRDMLVMIIIVMIILSPIIFILTTGLIQGFRTNLLPPDTALIVLNPLEYIYTRFLLAIVGAALVSMPLIIYEFFKFIRPGLYPSERHLFLRVVPLSLLFFILGGLFSYFVLIPFTVGSLISYAEGVATPMLVLSRFISFIAFMILSIGLIFQLPLVISFLVKGNLVTVRELKEKRKYAYPILLVGAIALAPDPTPVTPLVIAFILILVYEVSLVLARFLL
ncbi:MAG: twin-arginine translocase subunit TatC [Candidatus Hydrothermarchaeota archaeon]|nr:twin-arginine translocase subunit TatC [Candidatus Hydrothermarchaeota archaeon]